MHRVTVKDMDGLTWICLLQVFFQEAAVQEELKPGGLERRAGTAAGHGGDPVCRLCAHPALVNNSEN